MKHYYIKWYDFSNTYQMYYSETKLDEQVRLREFPDMEPISCKEAERLCIAERTRRRNDPAFSGYAPTVILPFEYWNVSPANAMAMGWLVKRRYCLERPKKKN